MSRSTYGLSASAIHAIILRAAERELRVVPRKNPPTKPPTSTRELHRLASNAWKAYEAAYQRGAPKADLDKLGKTRTKAHLACTKAATRAAEGEPEPVENPAKRLDAATVQVWSSVLDKAARGLNLNDEEDRTVFRIRVVAAAQNAKVGALREIVVALGGARPAATRLAVTRALAATRLPQRRIKNDGARAVAREYSKILGIPKSEMRKLTGKKFAKMQKSKRRALTPQQEQKLLKLLPSYPEDIRAGILLMLTLGLRVAELATIRPDSTGVNVVGKGNKARHVPFKVDPRSRGVVKAATGVANPSRLQSACRKMQKELPGLTPHVLRHTFATRAMQHGVDPKVLQAALGHDKFRTTIVYLSTIQK